MDKAVHVVFGYSFRNAFGPLNMNILEGKVPMISVSIASHYLKPWRQTLWGSLDRQDYTLHQSVVPLPRAMACFVDRIPVIEQGH